MFLKQMKIVGFKSFVEPTILYFNSNRVAVVGPNGCGKSNVIDAIRWVMGESSPKFLRGDLMSDVIFNGSLQRKPVGMASVEIILDNQTNYLQGAYIGKGEVAIRRDVNRSGESTYYINGHRVRRKDLTDLWLGTGAGARGYAIIGQNMINHLVEANPEVLRGYLEEAAGVSKYKERRKESAERLDQVAENLSRIDDIIYELSGQLTRLEKEAKDAHHYQKLKKDLREHQHLFEIAKARGFYEKTCLLEQDLITHASDEQSLQSQLNDSASQIATAEAQITNAQDSMRQEEQDLYQRRLQIEHQQQLYEQNLIEQRRLMDEQSQLRVELGDVQLQIDNEKFQQTSGYEQLNHLTGLLSELGIKKEQYQLQLQSQKQELRELGQKRHGVRQLLSQQKTQLQVLQAKHEQGQNGITHIQLQMQKWLQLTNTKDVYQLEQKVQESAAQLIPSEQQVTQLQIGRSELNTSVQVAQIQYEQLQQQKRVLQTQLDEASKRLMMTEASYNGLMANLEVDVELQANISYWLQQWHIPDAWRRIVDWLWSQFLPNALGEVDLQNPPSKGFIAKLRANTLHNCPPGLEPLMFLMKVGDYPAGFLAWQHIFVADSIEDALVYRNQLNESQSILTQDGLWFGIDWMMVIPKADLKNEGLASRLKAFQAAKVTHQNVLHEYEAFEQQFLHEEQTFLGLKSKLELHIKQYETQNLSHNLAKQQHQSLEQQLALFKQEQLRNKQELEACESQYAQLSAQNRSWFTQIEILQQSLIELEHQEQGINDNLHQMQDGYDHLENQLRQLEKEYQQHKLESMRLQTQYDFLRQSLPKLELRVQQIAAREQQIMELLVDVQKTPEIQPLFLAQLKQELEQKQTMLEACSFQLTQWIEQKKAMQQQQELLKSQHLKVLEKKWRLQSEQEKNNQDLELIKSNFNEDFSPHLWKNLENQQDAEYFRRLIVDLERQLESLGDVNLLAVGLFEQEYQRHQDMFAQQSDLKMAMQELNIAIETLDKDMQIELSKTLEAINTQLTVIFPQLFGGGEAKFVASCDNLLEASVAIQVQLPGKKQHRIQLLSGGEKALTAIALLFAIFSLNPAPFCLLDEVDAALDDANVIRLASLIKSMSDTVQFILITHNPLTMDVAEELVGVTMQEPGVSRVVSVNMAMALAMVNKE